MNKSQEQLEKIIEFYVGSLIPDKHKEELASAILSAMRIDEEALFKIISNLKIDKLASSIIAVDIASHAQEIIKFEEE